MPDHAHWDEIIAFPHAKTRVTAKAFSEVFMDYESLLELVKKRRSCRRFKPDPVPDEYIDTIIEVARWAPSGANSQPWEFIVIRNDDVKQKIAQLLDEQAVLTRKMDLAGRDDQPAASAGPVSLDAPGGDHALW
jgi:hypothetical protein